MYSEERFNTNANAIFSIAVIILCAGALVSFGIVILVTHLIWMAF